jgi:hypothetical protein
MSELGVTRTEILNKLNLSLHGKLEGYRDVIGAACKQDPEFLAHLIAWDFINGQIKDTKIALPVITLASKEFPDELTENSLAHLAMASPRDMAKALEFSIASGATARRQRAVEKTIRRYLMFRQGEPGKWSRLAARHRRALKTLYAKTHCPMPEWASKVLFGNQYVAGSIFADIAGLSDMAPAQVAATIQKWHLSPLVVSGAMAGAKAKQTDSAVVGATMDQMSDTETVTRAASLERKGLANDAVLKEKFRKKVSAATKSKKATLKTSVAADEVEDEGLKTMLRELQERQIQAQKDAGRGIDGNWLVIADRSQSQEVAIQLGVQIAAVITKFVTGKVYLVFCNGEATPMDVTGKTLEQIQGQAKFVFANGNTSYGIGLAWAIEKQLDLDGVVIVGDGGENTSPIFSLIHAEYRKRFDKSLPVYLYQTYCEPRYAQSLGGNPANFGIFMEGRSLPGMYLPMRTPVPFTKFDLTGGQVDYYSLPNLVQSMNASRFGVVEKVMACPLVTLDQVLPQTVAAGR